MEERAWAFLLDENMEPAVESFLESEGHTTEHVQDALSKGAKDEPEILPHARENDLVIVTEDVSDFGGVPKTDHAGLVLLYDQRVSAYEVANGILDIVEAYGDRDQFVSEPLDDWL